MRTSLRTASSIAIALCWVLIGHAPVAEAASKIVLTPEADAWVSDDTPDTNHGSDTTLQVRGSSPVSHAYLRFRGAIPPGAVITRTTLRLYFNSASSSNVQVRMTDSASNNWGEQTITFNNAPPSAAFPTAGKPVAGWNDFSVLPFDLFSGNPTTYILTRAADVAETVSVDSNESAYPPELIVEYTQPTTAPTTVCSPVGCIESKTSNYTMSWSTTIADFNGDGLQDYDAVTQQEQDRIQLQQPDGSFAPGFVFPLSDRHSCTAGDVNLDGRVDLFCALGAGSGEGTKQDELWIAKPDGTYVNESATWGLVDPYGRGRRPLFFDFNNDGLLDLYTTSLGFRPDGKRSENILWVNHGDPASGGGGFVEQNVGATGEWGQRCVADGDWNNDGRRDLLVCGALSSSHPQTLHLFQNQAGTDLVSSETALGTAINSPRDAVLADVNGDGWEDLLTVRTSLFQIRLNQGCSDCARFSHVDLNVPLVDGNSVAVGDLTGDGYQDVYIVQGRDGNDQNAPDILLAGPSWTSLAIPQADVGVGDTAEFIDVLGKKQVIVTNGYSPGSFYSRGPVQFISFHPASSPPPPVPVGPSSSPAKTRVAQLPSAERIIRLPSTRRCVTRKSLRIRLRKVSGVTFSSLAVFVNGKRVKVVKQHLDGVIRLSKTPKRPFLVKVVLTTTDGRKVTRSRRYRGCRGR
jgi:hypothetical protein